MLTKFWLYSKTMDRLRRQICVTGNVSDRPRSGYPRVPIAADDHYIVLQHIPNRRLTSAAIGRQGGFHPQSVRNRLRQNDQPICATGVRFVTNIASYMM